MPILNDIKFLLYLNIIFCNIPITINTKLNQIQLNKSLLIYEIIIICSFQTISMISLIKFFMRVWDINDNDDIITSNVITVNLTSNLCTILSMLPFFIVWIKNIQNRIYQKNILTKLIKIENDIKNINFSNTNIIPLLSQLHIILIFIIYTGIELPYFSIVK